MFKNCNALAKPLNCLQCYVFNKQCFPADGVQALVVRILNEEKEIGYQILARQYIIEFHSKAIMGIFTDLAKVKMLQSGLPTEVLKKLKCQNMTVMSQRLDKKEIKIELQTLLHSCAEN